MLEEFWNKGSFNSTESQKSINFNELDVSSFAN